MELAKFETATNSMLNKVLLLHYITRSEHLHQPRTDSDNEVKEC